LCSRLLVKVQRRLSAAGFKKARDREKHSTEAKGSWANTPIIVLVIVVGVEEPTGQPRGRCFYVPIWFDALKQFSDTDWRVVVIGAVFTLARSSEAFLVLRAQQVGIAVKWVPLVMVVMRVTYTLSAYPAGTLSDRTKRRSLLGVGLLLLIFADLVLAWAASLLMILFGAALWGLHRLRPIQLGERRFYPPTQRHWVGYGDRCRPTTTFYTGSRLSLSALVMFRRAVLSLNRACR
jgi:MFS family permease